MLETDAVRTPVWLREVRAVLLDMDGTLVDSDADVERAWRTWAAEYGADVERVMAIQPGRAAESTVRIVAPHLDDAGVVEAARRQSELQIEDAPGTTPLPGARELLATLDELGLPWAVVTGAVRPLARARLAAAAITPPELVTVDEVAAGKPEPDGFLLAAARLAVEPGRCLVVEDAPAGIESGRRAGARVAALRGLSADLALADLHELTRMLRAAEASARGAEAPGPAG
jgi:HAD superfamily hydrolase (TIGR01509 family)